MHALGRGVEVSAIGALLVFGMLGLLWGLIAVLMWADRRSSATPPRVSSTPETIDAATMAAVMVAVRLHLRALRRQAAPAARVHVPGALPSRWVATGRTRQNRSFTPRGRYT
jgi:hypothetical protein